MAGAEELYETYRQRSRSPAAQVIDELKRAVSDAVSRGLEWSDAET